MYVYRESLVVCSANIVQVFGNSNSLPISLVISLSKTLKGLHWDKIPGDNDDEVAARGILYLLIFQQLGQLVRWTWGYNVLLAPASQYHEDEQDGAENQLIEEGRYTDDPEDDRAKKPNGRNADSDYGSGSHTPSTISTLDDNPRQNTDVLPTPANGNIVGSGPGNMAGNLGDRQRSTGHITTFPTYSSVSQRSSGEDEPGVKGIYFRCRSRTQLAWYRFCSTISTFFRNLFRRLPTGVQSVLSKINFYVMKFLRGLWEFMNPPLWAMLIAIIVASIPKLQHLFFDKGTFISNSVTRAVSQSGGVAVPLILVVLGANLARNTLPAEDVNPSPEAKKEERNLLIASLVSRMLLPTVIMAPILALIAKYVPVSILDDPIFVIVCFLLTGAPSALQLAQICQINNVFMGAMSRLLFQSYVIWYVALTLIVSPEHTLINLQDSPEHSCARYACPGGCGVGRSIIRSHLAGSLMIPALMHI